MQVSRCSTGFACIVYDILAICTNRCVTNMKCTTIILLTLQFNECLQNIYKARCTNTNSSYYCSCDTSSVFATDGVHFLGRLCKNVEI